MKALLLSLALLAGAASAQDNCEALRTQIEGRIRETGVTNLSVTIIEADAAANGRVVGSCAMGKKKIVYLQQSASAPAAPRVPMLTECRDGSMPVDGRCK